MFYGIGLLNTAQPTSISCILTGNCILWQAIGVLNKIAAELDILNAMQSVRQVALELLDCERVTLFLIFERRNELRWVSALAGESVGKPSSVVGALCLTTPTLNPPSVL